jgi:hypothetical protein
MVLSFISLCALASCAYIENPHPDGESYRDRPTSIGSNLPKKGTAVSVDPADVEDAIRRSSTRNVKTGGGT